MNVWLVSPAWRRFDVTRLALAQRRHLCDELAARGIAAHGVIVADDENLDIAREFGFEAVEMDNKYLGRKVNAGIRLACVEGGADYVVAIGSDDWLHASTFERLAPVGGKTPRTPEVLAGTTLAVVDLLTSRLRICHAQSRRGTIPWIIPRKVLEPSGFEPVDPRKRRGIDGSMVRGFWRKPTWQLHDPHPFARVDFKSTVNITPYSVLDKALGSGRTLDPWVALADHYPAELIELGRETEEALA